MRTHARSLAIATAITLTVSLAACGDDGDGAAASDTTASDARDDDDTTTTSPPTPEEQAIAAYQASWDATFLATNPPQQLPEVTQTHAGEALSETLNLIAEKAHVGHRIEGSMQTHPVVVSATSTEVLLDDCAIENSVEYDAAGQVVDTADDAAYNYRVTVVDEGGSWKVSDFERREDPCEPE